MADKKISQLSSASTPLAGTEVLPIVQSSATVKVATDDLTVKNVRSNATTGILQIAGPGAGTTRVMTVPNANFTAARTDTAQTFTGTQKFSSQAQAEATSATTWSATTLNTDTFRSTNLSATANSFTAFGYQVTNSDASTGFVITAAIASGSFSADWAVQNRNAGNYQENFRVKAAGDVDVAKGNLLLSTAGKGLQFAGNSNVLWRVGAGTPEGAVTAPIGSLFTRTDGGANTTLYVKESGAGNTGWVAK